MTPTKELANFVACTNFNDFPTEVISHAKTCIVDWLGVAIAGSLAPSAQIATSIVRELQGRPESTIIGADFKTSCINASLVNGILGHSIELDDVHEQAIIHPAAAVLPAALAVAERCRCNGRDLISWIIVGYEVEIRIGTALNPSHYQYWHPTGTCGTLGATAATANILNLNAEQTIHALGIACTQAAGLITVFGTMSKAMNAGRAAQSGVQASLLAQNGFTSSMDALEAPNGYLHATSQNPAINTVTERLGEEYEILNTSFKRHASCGHTHGAIDATLILTQQYNIPVDGIDTITVGTYPIAVNVVGTNYAPESSLEAKFSLPYCVAIALINGKAGLTDFSENNIANPKVHELASKIQVKNDPEYKDARLGSAWVKIRTTDERELYHRVDIPKGFPQNQLTKMELENKFTDLASLTLPKMQVKQLIDTIDTLDKNKNLQQLTKLLQINKNI